MPGGSGDGPVLWDDKTEMALLRSRLDEQSQLICMLKRRADDTLLRCQGLEADNRELERRSADTEGLLTAERRRAEQMEDRFGILAANHQEMIRFKDEYKRQNGELRAECERLREEERSIRVLQEGAELREGADLQEKERSIRDLREQLRAMEGERGAEVEELRVHQETSTAEILSLTRRLQLSEETLQHLQEKLSHLEEVQKAEQKEAEKKMAELNREKQDLLDLCMERGRSLQEHQREAANVTHHLQSAEKARLEAEERYRRDVTATDADARIVALNARLADSEKELAQRKREFEAYKKHSGELLAKERELNAKLRHLIG